MPALPSFTVLPSRRPFHRQRPEHDNENDDEHETSELVRQQYLKFYSHVYSQFRRVLGGCLGVV
jgi:hypothetical protein